MTHAQYTVGTTPVKVFEGTGKIRIDSDTVFLGDSAVAVSTGAQSRHNVVYEFLAPAEVWAVSTSPRDVRVIHWY